MRTTLLSRRATAVIAVVLGAGLWAACSDQFSESLVGPAEVPQLSVQGGQEIAAAIAAQERHTPELMRMRGVVGTAVGLLPNGRAAVRIFLESAEVHGLPGALDGIPTAVEVTGRFMALSDPTTRQRPAPTGFSVGHPSITAGTIASRVKNSSGQLLFALSNNHVLANSNNASLGDPTLQPGPYDGGTIANDQIGTLHAFQPIDFSGGPNTMDAAIALTSTDNVGNATPTDDGYGTPNPVIWGDANNDRVFDNKSALLGVNVQKYGRTTKLTHGQITGINASVNVCYEVIYIGNTPFCVKSASFVDQLIIEPGTFSGGGDSGSLIVTDDGDRHPVALLFAGSASQTIANRIDLVLNRFGVSVDGMADTVPPPPPPEPVTDVAIQSVSAPSSATQGDAVNVVVTVKNVGTEDVTAAFDVTLKDSTDNVLIGTQTVAGLSAGASAALTFGWSTTGSSTGSHTLIARHTIADDNNANDVGTAVVTVNPEGTPTAMHVGDLDGIASDDGSTWSAIVEIAVHDQNHQPLNGATVVGSWSRNGLNADTCTTGELGGDGTCIVLFPSLKRGFKSVTFTVTGVTLSGVTYQATGNHDPDGDSNGTAITVNRP
jgi:hypothetical protein